MPDLSLRNIDQISNDVRQEGITFSHLLEDLIDHICCDVEYEMQQGLDFIQAYNKVRKKIGSGRRLSEIQEETLYIVDSKYRKMKKLMKFSAIAGTILLGFAALFKIQHWPGAGIMFTLGAFILAFIFMPSALGVLWKETHSSKKILLLVSGFSAGFLFILGTLFKVQHWPGAASMLLLAYLIATLLFIPSLLVNRLRLTELKHKKLAYITGAIGLIFFITGMLFKIQHWPLASILMVIGLFCLGFIAFPLYVWQTWKNEEQVKAPYIYLVIAAALIVIPGALINLSLQTNYDAGYFKSLSSRHSLFLSRYDINTEFVNKHRDSVYFNDLSTLHQKTSEVLGLLGDVEVEMILASEGKPGTPATFSNAFKMTEKGPVIQFTALNRPFHNEIVGQFLNNGTESRNQIDRKLKDYSEFITSLNQGTAKNSLMSLLDQSLFLANETNGNKAISLMSGLNSVEVLKNNVLTVEAGTLTTITGKK